MKRKDVDVEVRDGELLDTERVDARLDSGVMLVEIPKPERTSPRKVTVGGNEEAEESS